MDVRLASERARIGFVFGRLGIVPEACSSWPLPRIVGIGQALEWVYAADILTARGGARRRAGALGAPGGSSCSARRTTWPGGSPRTAPRSRPALGPEDDVAQQRPAATGERFADEPPGPGRAPRGSGSSSGCTERTRRPASGPRRSGCRRRRPLRRLADPDDPGQEPRRARLGPMPSRPKTKPIRARSDGQPESWQGHGGADADGRRR